MTAQTTIGAESIETTPRRTNTTCGANFVSYRHESFRRLIAPTPPSADPSPGHRGDTRLLCRSWVTAAVATILIDVVLRKPIAVLTRAGINTLRDLAHLPEEVFIGNGGSRMSLSRL